MDLDSALRCLAEQPLHPRLDELEGDVMRLVAAKQRVGGGVTLRSGALAALGAVALGLAGGGLSSTAATAQVPTLTPFGPAMPLAPSTLLAFQ
ncbi:hypothetical protein [Tardiphaga sp.]|uniref:hypothetical protein n=1 Tax=Tardiphaga sp. TaxID=1926292 RepID=UPI00352B8250